MTIQLTFTSEDLAALSEMRYIYPHPIVQRRAETLWLKSFDLPHHQIAKIGHGSKHAQSQFDTWGISAAPEMTI